MERTYALVVCDADDNIEKLVLRQVRSTRKEVGDFGYGGGIVAVWLAAYRASSMIYV
jgi:methylase of polypeptide subunit release factors